ncbi:hypothetical protein PENSPDRAFT_658899 [Peniophora sp. CONT]|nr:hypothetical protein PENSPDRAFT_658899 [Peniophora sp. CONT]
METLVNAPRPPPGQPTRGRTAQRQPSPRDHEREFGTLAGTYGFGDGLLGPPPLNPPGFKSKKAEKAAKAARKAASREASASPSASPSPSASSSRSPLRSFLSTGRSSSRLSPNYIPGSASQSQSQRSLSATSSSAQGYMSTDTLLPPLSSGQDAQPPSTSEARAGEGTSRSTAEEPEMRGER